MAGNYSDTSNIVDKTQVDAADVKTPIDALDDALNDFMTGARKAENFVSIDDLTAVEYGAQGEVRIQRAQGSAGSESAVGAFVIIGRLAFAGYDGSAYGDGARLDVYSYEGYSGSGHGGGIDLLTTVNGTTTPRKVASWTPDGQMFMTNIPGSVSNFSGQSGFYAKDVSGTSEAFVVDAAGNETQLSSHNFELFDPDPTADYPWSFYAENQYLGARMAADMWRALKDLEALTGKTYIHVEALPPGRVKTWDDAALDPRGVARGAPPAWLAIRLEAKGRRRNKPVLPVGRS